MDKISCPVCTRLNDSNENRCWFCSAELHPTAPTPGSNNDWLTGMEADLNVAQETQNEETLENIEVASSSEDIPEWLAKIRAREAAERAQQKTEEDLLKAQKKSQGGVPDWLSSIGEGIELSTHLEQTLPVDSNLEVTGEAPPVPEQETVPPPESESDWMESLKSWKPVNTQENFTEKEGITTSAEDVISESPFGEDDREIDLGGSIKPPEDADLPVIGEFEETPLGEDNREKDVVSWFTTVEDIDYPVINSESEVTPKGNNAEINDSFAFISPELEAKDQIAQVFEELQSQVEPEEIVLPDLVEDKTASKEIKPVTAPSVFEGGDSINEVASIEPMNNSGAEELVEATHFPAQSIIPDEAIEETESSEPFKPDILPDWLNDEQIPGAPEVKPEPKPAKVRMVVDETLPKPEKANLPVWLDAMRPIEAVELPAIPSTPVIPGKPTENLEGIESLVADGKMLQAAGRPSDLGGGLKVTERQKANASLLSLMSSNVEGTIDEESKTVKTKQYVLWRAFLALVFIAIAIIGGTALIDYGLQPALFPEEVVHTFDQINSLPIDKPILIAGDFEAGLAGEIRWSSQPLIEHLMRRNLAIALISTNPVDTALLFAQITKGLGAVPNYPVFEKVVDLGYLPGGAIAIQSLHGEFSKSVPLTAELIATSTHPLLSSVKSLKDFGAIIIITDDSENARIWIEQIQPQLTDTPLLMVTSAQAAPLIQPYYQSGQLAGLVSGMPGSLVYERILQTPGDATSHLSSLQLLSVLMAGLVLVGGFISMVKPVESGDKA